MSHRCLSLVLLLASWLPCGASAVDRGFEFSAADDRLQIDFGGEPVATYIWRDAEIPRPYFAHLRTLGGTQVTRNHPPVEGQDRTDHATFHPGLWLAFGDISGADFWRNKAAVAHRGFAAPANADFNGGFTVRNEYVSDGNTVCEETCQIDFRRRPGGYVITWDSVFTGKHEFAFGDQEEMGLGVRLATPLSVKSGGRMVNSDGRVNESEVWGQQADWCGASGTIDGVTVGVALFSDPANFRRPWFHARDYGLLVANPFGENAFTKGPRSHVVVRPGEKFRLRYGVFVYEGEVDVAAAYSDWLAGIGRRENR